MVSGWVFDATGSYYASFVIAGTMIGLSGLMLFVVPCIKPLLERRKQGQQPETEELERSL